MDKGKIVLVKSVYANFAYTANDGKMQLFGISEQFEPMSKSGRKSD
jgi:hypothetical protein